MRNTTGSRKRKFDLLNISIIKKPCARPIPLIIVTSRILVTAGRQAKNSGHDRCTNRPGGQGTPWGMTHGWGRFPEYRRPFEIKCRPSPILMKTGEDQRACTRQRPLSRCAQAPPHALGVIPMSSLPASQSSSPAAALPPLSQRVLHFMRSLKDHARQGLEQCSQDEIDARLAICQECPSFTGTHCQECGCACSGRSKFFNKLAWKSEKCPLEKW